LLLSERPSLEAASSEHDSLPFFGRAAGIEVKRMGGGGGGGGKPLGEAVAIDNERRGGLGQDFEQSQPNHGGARFGQSLWIFGKIQYQV
jgi:hypothetical protein